MRRRSGSVTLETGKYPVLEHPQPLCKKIMNMLLYYVCCQYCVNQQDKYEDYCDSDSDYSDEDIEYSTDSDYE